ncbi:mitochondrial protein Pet127-domain-containing protein [Mucidula mucida]|nr:mitochondrial protein Pet127-domain-containing protein [Mucidula mucida]
MSFSGFDEAAGSGWEPAPQAGDLIKDALRKEQLLKEIAASQDDLRTLYNRVQSVQKEVDKLTSNNSTLQIRPTGLDLLLMSVLGTKHVGFLSSAACRTLATAATASSREKSNAPLDVTTRKKKRPPVLPSTAGSSKAYEKLSSNILSTLDMLTQLHDEAKMKDAKSVVGPSSKRPTPQEPPDSPWQRPKTSRRLRPVNTQPTMVLKGQKILKETRKPYARSIPAHTLEKPKLTKAEKEQRTRDIRLKLETKPYPEALDNRTITRLKSTQSQTLQDIDPLTEHRPVARLSHGLERVLFKYFFIISVSLPSQVFYSPGVHWLRDPNSGVYNFHPKVQSIPKVNDFAFERLPGFTKSSRDEELWALAKQEGRTFAGSTSSLSGMLVHIYFLLSSHRQVNLSSLTHVFAKEPRNFTPGQRLPATVVFNYKDGRYAIDSLQDEKSQKNILMWMGTLLEKYLTSHADQFGAFMRTTTPPPDEDVSTESMLREAFRFAKSEKFVMRSQLDCQDHRLPGTGVFDIKTRASLSIRMDLFNFEHNSGYLIEKRFGLHNSFEKEYYDLIRSAFLKYSFQARIGNMDGVFIAYHNTERMFGFQYASLREMEDALEAVADRIAQCFPEQSVKCTFETLEKENAMHVWVEPEHWEGEGPAPIKQLAVTVKHFVNGVASSAQNAIDNTEATWSPELHIGERRPKMEKSIRQSLDEANLRKFRMEALPENVSIDEIMDFWKNLNFGGPDAPSTVPDAEYFASNFGEPDAMIIALRQAAKQGRKQTQQREKEEKGLPVFVVGEQWDEEDAKAKKRALEAIRAKEEEAKAEHREQLLVEEQWNAFGEDEVATQFNDVSEPKEPAVDDADEDGDDSEDAENEEPVEQEQVEKQVQELEVTDDAIKISEDEILREPTVDEVTKAGKTNEVPSGRRMMTVHPPESFKEVGLINPVY